MAHAGPESVRTGRPPLDKFIMALFLVKSKPASASVREYLKSLRSFFREGRQPPALDVIERHIDSVAFWKSSYEKSEQVQETLRVKIEELEQRLQEKPEPSSQASSRSRLPKRKQNENDAAKNPYDRARKRAKTTDHSRTIKVRCLSLDELGTDLRASEDSQSNNLLQGVYLLQQAASQKAPGKEMQSLLIRVLFAMRSVISGIQINLYSPAWKQLKARTTATRTQEQRTAHQQALFEVEAEDKLTAIARLFPMVMQVLHKLGQTSEGTSLRGQPIYHTILLFQRLLEQISRISIAQGNLNRAATPRSRKPHGRIERQIADYLLSPKATHVDAIENGKIFKLLMQLAMVIISALDPLKATDNEILDGIMFFLLSHTGKLLREFVFEDEKENGNLHMESISIEDVAIHEAQAPYVIHLLRHAMRITAKGPRSAIATRRTSNDLTSQCLQNSKIIHNDFSREARIKLQNTMLKGFFGNDAKELGEGLLKPLGEDMECSSGDSGNEKNENVKRWYISEVWKLVGWDILRETVQG